MRASTQVSGFLSAVWSVPCIGFCAKCVNHHGLRVKCSPAWQKHLHKNSSSSYIAQPGYWCPSQYASLLPNQSTWQGTLRPETWSEQEALYLVDLPHLPASCSETSDSSSTASTTKRKRNTWSTAEEEILINLWRERKSGLKGSGSSQKWKQIADEVNRASDEINKWRQNTTKSLKGVQAHSKVLSKKAVHGRISMDLPKPSLVSLTYPDSRTIHSMENRLLTSTRN